MASSVCYRGLGVHCAREQRGGMRWRERRGDAPQKPREDICSQNTFMSIACDIT